MVPSPRDEEVKALKEENARLKERVRELDDALCDRIYRDEQSVVSEQEISETCEGLRAAVGEFAKFLSLSIPKNKHGHLEPLADKYESDLAAIRHRSLMRTLMARHIWEVTLGAAQKRLLSLSSGEINFVECEGMVGERLRDIQNGQVDARKKKDTLRLAEEICPWRASTVRLRGVILRSPSALRPNDSALKEERLLDAWSDVFKTFPDHQQGAFSAGLFVREGEKVTPLGETRLKTSKAKLGACLERATKLVELIGSSPAHVQFESLPAGTKGAQERAAVVDFVDTDEEPVVSEEDEIAHCVYPMVTKYGDEYGLHFDKARILLKAEVLVKPRGASKSVE